ncbi:molybdenum cofactor biosynthesis protein MoaE [Gilvimarinus sp. SDUM040013]|uniref:Molybdopterin synthase catalytic subunit n=1 Tax=Gilvimarinus gilvus TaxID=3058038 RepID=A0ABU4RTZ5_9GAMM|nr:molybdenum cofactor biosynthesis protein MoaE [Gilvimarinus sp. SDUM040013]MDO3386972.1 molybdenum cofactor biosynthesis protein MoaE [Gilvimarinus sp. SDUM040013]MDX6848134.1 molybdenum cofactor biosynthesis protein MoaE [Gilvimarinus sp. SDUM040013]
MNKVRVQHKAFCAAQEYQAVVDDGGANGAIVMFTGRVRADGASNPVTALELEHYPGMTEQVLERLVLEARARWQITEVRLIHRVGKIAVGEDIVLVLVSSAHRQQAFSAAEFLMDKLKTTATFWKKEHRLDGSSKWVEAKTSDDAAASRWD